MSNTLSKIHYGALIQTNSDKTSSTIGLTSGVFFYTTDGYTPSESDSWESGYTGIGNAEPNELPWNTDLMSSNGLSSLGSKIDIISGGDYAYLQSANVKLVNKTSLGNTIHKTIELTSGLAVSGSTMIIYVIIDGVWYPRWTGMVSGTTFNDTNYTFVGADEKSNATDTLTSTIIGMIDAEVEYNPLGELKTQNLIAYRFDDNDGYEDYSNHIRQNEASQTGGEDVGTVLFNGMGNYSSQFVVNKDVPHTVQVIANISGSEPLPVVGDMLKYESDSSIYTIIDRTFKSYDTTFTVILQVAKIDDDSLDYTFCFGDPTNQFTGTVADGLNTLTSVDDGEKCYFSLYRALGDTGIDQSALESASTVTVIKDGVEYVFNYTVNAEGGVSLDHPASASVVKPTKIEYFKEETDIFEQNSYRDWGNFEDALASATDITSSITNDIDPTSSYYTIGDASDSESVFHYFYLTFNEEDVIDRNELQLGCIIKGLFDSDNQAWEEAEINGSLGWYAYKQGNYSDSSTPTHPSAVTFANADEIGATQSLYTNIRYYRITKDLTFGRIPLLEPDEVVLPNIVSNTGTCVDDGDAYSFVSNSQPVTNMPHYENEAYTTYNNIHAQDRQTNVGFAKMYPTGTINEDATLTSNTVNLLVSFRADNNAIPQKCIHRDSAGNETNAQLQTQQRLVFKINSLFLFDIADVSQAETTITYKATDENGNNTYTDVLENVSNGGDVTALSTARDTWLSGLQIKEQEQRYQVSPIAKVYNEFELTGSFGELSVKSVTEESFPDFGDDYSDYVVGVDVYADARELWERARRAYLDTGAIHKAPSDRTKLDFASTESSISVYSSEYLDLLLDWTTYPKLQTYFLIGQRILNCKRLLKCH